MPVEIELSRVLTASPGAFAPTFGIDLGDDGIFELFETGLPSGTYWRVLGPTPIAIRLRSQVTQTGPGSVALRLHVTIRPANNLTVSPVAMPCASNDMLQVLPSFVGQGIETLVYGTPPTGIVVLGLGPFPQALPTTSATPCVLLPSPDLVIYAPYPQTFYLPLPAAVRPLTLWMQGVSITPTGLGTTLGYTVLAW